jgi:prevent-host-death family protein
MPSALAGAERIPVTEASARGIARLAKDAEHGSPVVITRHGRPVAAVVPLAVDHPRQRGTRTRETRPPTPSPPPTPTRPLPSRAVRVTPPPVVR